ncbi:MAG: ribosome biogenesis GTP-binding protein YihA/YsxC [Gammaproteobacteria bacterium]|nr:ribosome biogenesis GTP-binding protein YihA/YsxC [Gammaproteobacteria bacterium]
MRMSIDFKQITFLKSAAELEHLPFDEGAEVAFAGRSNAGKSSAINAVTQHKHLAKTSKTPGCTQLINLFSLSETKRLVDLPGYGYAKVPKAVKFRWQDTLAQYLQTRQCLRGLILLTDIRHPLNPYDISMLEWATEVELPVIMLLTKADKLGFGAAKKTVTEVKAATVEYPSLEEVVIFSAHAGTNLDVARALISKWLV